MRDFSWMSGLAFGFAIGCTIAAISRADLEPTAGIGFAGLICAVLSLRDR